MTDPAEQIKMQPAPGTSFRELRENHAGDETSTEMEEDSEVLEENGHIPPSKSTVRAVKLLKRMDGDLSKVRHEIEDEDGILHDEQSQLLSRVAPDDDATVIKPLDQSTAATEIAQSQMCGLTWRHLVAIGLVMIVFVPLILVVLGHDNLKHILENWHTGA